MYCGLTNNYCVFYLIVFYPNSSQGEHLWTRKLLDILACPVCKGPLKLSADKTELISKGAGLAYPIRDGIPVMLETEARTLYPKSVWINDPGFTVVIPSRFASTRLPGKPLQMIAGKPMVQHVWEQACKSSAQRVVVATDDARIVEACKAFGAEVLLTRAGHESGTDRLAEVATQLGLASDAIVVNVQGDEPMIPPRVIDQVAVNLAADEHGDPGRADRRHRDPVQPQCGQGGQ